MKIACLQFAPRLGEVEANISRADRVLAESGIVAGEVDLLVLPELAFSGYNFESLQAITPFLEPTGTGVSTRWAQDTARRLRCTVVVGYAEVASAPRTDLVPEDAKPKEAPLDDSRGIGRPVVPRTDADFPHNYNSTVTVDHNGKIVHHYRKVHLYYTDTTWAREGDSFGSIMLQLGEHGCRTTMGICMDLNNKNFTAPWTDWEFANSVMTSHSQLAVVSMAWLSQELTPESVQGSAAPEPDLQTMGYWAERMRPVIESARSDELGVLAVFANRAGVEGTAIYAGTSCVMALGNGNVRVFGFLGKGEEKVLVVDTATFPKYSMKTREP